MNVSLTPEIEKIIQGNIHSGRYDSANDVIREALQLLAWRDEVVKARKDLEGLLMEGIRSGEPTEMTREDWDDIRREGITQFEQRKTRKTLQEQIEEGWQSAKRGELVDGDAVFDRIYDDLRALDPRRS